MGILISRMWETLWPTGDPSRILMLGLDAAGKTTILYKLKLNENIATIPTIGFNVETVEVSKRLTMTIWDVGGQENLRKLWRYYYQNSEGLIYIVDSADHERILEARDELFTVIRDSNMRGVPVVVFCNKQDLPGAMTTSEIADRMNLGSLRDRKWFVQGTCATSGDGLYEGFSEMASFVKEFKKQSNNF